LIEGIFDVLIDSAVPDSVEHSLYGVRAEGNAKTEPQGEKMIVLLVRAILCADDRTTRAVVQMGRAYRLHGVSRRLRTAQCCVWEFPGKWVDLGRDLLDRKGSVSNSRIGIKMVKLRGICHFRDVLDGLLEGG
jgi:hypothetical protein